MPSIYYLNAPPHPFWDFVSGMEDHPFFAQHRRADAGADQAQPREQGGASGTTANTSEKSKGKQPEVNDEDTPEIDPSTVRSDRQGTGMPFRGRGRFAKAFDYDNDESKEKNDNGEGEDRHRGKRGCHDHRRSHDHGHGPWGRGGPPFGGPPGFMFGPNFNFPFGPQGPWSRGPTEDHEGHGPHPGFRGRGGPCRGRAGRHHHGPHSRSPPRGGPFVRGPGGEGGFDLSSFLSNLGSRIGVDLTSAAEGLGLKTPRSTETDFEPRTDIFDTPDSYTIHLSLPGAKKSDVGVDWDGEHSTLRIAGVVHRPGVDEEMMTKLVVDGRKRETGVFEKMVRLGTARDPASIAVEGISAKMVDGVLVVRVPKTEKTFEKKEVLIDSPALSDHTPLNEKDLLFDADENEEMYDAEPEHHDTPAETKEREARDDRSETLAPEAPKNATTETLPRYEVNEPEESKLAKEFSQDDNMSDWEKEGSEDEAEYVKINVD
jgi:HSP20 family protein